jgi:hypothetical protein
MTTVKAFAAASIPSKHRRGPVRWATRWGDGRALGTQGGATLIFQDARDLDIKAGRCGDATPLAWSAVALPQLSLAHIGATFYHRRARQSELADKPVIIGGSRASAAAVSRTYGVRSAIRCSSLALCLGNRHFTGHSGSSRSATNCARP